MSTNNKTTTEAAKGKRELCESSSADVTNCNNKMSRTVDSSEEAKQNLVYTKRPGTNGINGQLYETKLLTLVLLRVHKAHEDKKIENFFLATNLDGVGALDDLILSYEMEGRRKKLFVQTKHRDDPSKKKITWNEICSENGDLSIFKYFDSYLEIISKVDATSSNANLKIELKNVEMNLIYYTPAEVDIGAEEKKFLKELTTDNNNFFKTSDKGKIFQISCNNPGETLVKLAEHQMKQLAATLGKFIFSEGNIYESMMEDYMIKIYHVMLAEDVIDITERPQGDYVEGKIRSGFHESEDDFIKILRNELYEAAIVSEKAETSNLDTVEKNLKEILEDPTSENISDLLGSTLKFEKNGKLTLVGKAKAMINTNLRKAIANLKISPELINEAVNKTGKKKLSSITFKLPMNFGNRNFQTNEIAQLGVKLAESFQSGTNVLCENIVRDFLSKFKFYVSQPKEDEVEEITKNELKYCQVLSSNLPIENEVIYTALHEKILKWWKQPNGYYLTEKSEILIETQKIIVPYPLLFVSNSFYLSKVKYVDIKFNEKSVEKLNLEIRQFIQDTNQQYLNIVTNIKELTAIKLLQYFEMGETQNCNYFIDYDYVLKRGWFIGIINEISTKEGLNLVVDCGNLRDLSILNGLKKVIFLTCKESKKMSEYEIFENYREFEDIEIDFLSLDSKSQEKLLKEGKVIFQGRELPLDDVVDDDAKSFINGEILLKLLNRDRVEVGKEVANLDADKVPYYIERRIQFDNKSLNSIPEGLFIHNFVYGDKHNVIVISAEPGMGKSTVLTHMALFLKETGSNSLLWLVRINLNDHTQSLTDLNLSEENNDQGNIQNASDFLLKMVKLKTNIETKLFERYLSRNSKVKVILFIDGFDEISPNYGNRTQRLLEIIKNAKAAKILVTTRPYSFVYELKTKLNARLCVLDGFDICDKQIYLERFWSGTLENEGLRAEHTRKFITILDKHLDTEFLSNPLHLKLIAEYYKDEFQRFCTSTDDDEDEANILKNRINRITLYEKIIKIKYYEIFVDEKKGLDRTKPAVKFDEEQELFPKFVDEHKILALHFLFDKDEFREITSREIDQQKLEKLLKQFGSGEKKAGIISTVIDGRAQFVHRTFAEYFAGIYFANKLMLMPLKDLKKFDFFARFKSKNAEIFNFISEVVKKSKPSSDMNEKLTYLLNHYSSVAISEKERDLTKFILSLTYYFEKSFQLNGSKYFQKMFGNFDDNGKFLLLAFAYASEQQSLLEFLLKEIDMGVIRRVFNRDPNAFYQNIKLHDMNDIFSSSSLVHRIWKEMRRESFSSNHCGCLKVRGWVISLMEFVKCRGINLDYESAWNIITKRFLEDVTRNKRNFRNVTSGLKWTWQIYYKALLIEKLDLNELKNLSVGENEEEHFDTDLTTWELIERDSELSKDNDLRKVFFICRDLFDNLKNKRNKDFITLFNELKPNDLGVVINVRDKDGNALIDRAVELENEKIINLLKNSGAKCNFECSFGSHHFFDYSKGFRENLF